MNAGALSKTQINVITRFCIFIGDRAEISTRCLLRPLSPEILEAAFKTREEDVTRRIADLEKKKRNYNPEDADEFLISYFEGAPSRAQYSEYIDCLIKQETENPDIRKFYSVSVDYGFLKKERLDFHNSLNPVCTFGYSSMLHELCAFDLSEELKSWLYSAFPDRCFPGCGAFFTEGAGEGIFYEDLCVEKNGKIILETISHEEDVCLHLTSEQLSEFAFFEGKEQRNSKILKKLGN